VDLYTDINVSKEHADIPAVCSSKTLAPTGTCYITTQKTNNGNFTAVTTSNLIYDKSLSGNN
jgi:hypothetical protein